MDTCEYLAPVSDEPLAVNYDDIVRAQMRIDAHVIKTDLAKNLRLSHELSSNIFFKREDQQHVRSFKLRGALNKILSLSDFEIKRGVVTASAGNHAQGVAYACQQLGVMGDIFLPINTPKQKVSQVRYFGGDKVNVVLFGETYDEACAEAYRHQEHYQKTFIHAFDDPDVIAGQGTVAMEILAAHPTKIDFLFIPVGGGGLASGVATVFNQLSPCTQIIGVETIGAAAMNLSIKAGSRQRLAKVDAFADGTAVQMVGDKTFNICQKLLNDVVLVKESDVSKTLISLYNEHGMVVEPSGALSVTALSLYANQIKNKVAVCILSGANNDAVRFSEYYQLANAS